MVVLDFNFKDIGQIQAKLHLTDNNISTVFLAENKNTVINIENKIDILNTAFKKIGFDAINLGVTQGNIEQAGYLPRGIQILDETV